MHGYIEPTMYVDVNKTIRMVVSTQESLRNLHQIKLYQT